MSSNNFFWWVKENHVPSAIGMVNDRYLQRHTQMIYVKGGVCRDQKN